MDTHGDTKMATDPALERERPNGPVMAAVVAAGFGSFVLGLLTTLNEASTKLHDWLPFREPVGPLSGKTTLAVAGWAGAWIVLGLAWRRKEVDFRKALIASTVLLALGILGTFPTFFEQFTVE